MANGNEIKYELIVDTSQYDESLKKSDKWTKTLDDSIERLGQSSNKAFSFKGLNNATKPYVVSLKSLNSELRKNISTSQAAKLQNEALLRLREKLAPSVESERRAIDKINTRLSQNANFINKVSGAKRQATGTNDAYNASLKQQSQLLGQMRNQLAGLFSVYAAERFIRKMVQVRGEFELQSVALTAMLQDRKLADQLFTQVQDLALKSPFKILELNKYLKQLKAYRIENEDLVGTLKQLGDISAGLGVSMDRLILAYGQVRAASVLRGTELRQFTEAGIPLVDQLAKKFSELENRVVGTDEIFEKISNRQVSFEMVRDIFTDMTKEGGIFFDQQLKQSETLSGQVSILADAWDKMLNELGKANDGLFKGAISGARALIENYDIVLAALKTIIATYGTYKAVLIAINIQGQISKYGSLAKAIKITSTAQKRFNIIALRNPYVAVAAVITTLITSIGVLIRRQKKEAAALKESIRPIQEKAMALDDLQRQYNNLSLSEDDRLKVLQEIKKINPDIIEGYENEAKVIQDVNDKLTDQVNILRGLALIKSKDKGKAVSGYEEALEEYKLQEDAVRDLERTIENSYTDIYTNIKNASDNLRGISPFKDIINSELNEVEKVKKINDTYRVYLKELKRDRNIYLQETGYREQAEAIKKQIDEFEDIFKPLSDGKFLGLLGKSNIFELSEESLGIEEAKNSLKQARRVLFDEIKKLAEVKYPTDVAKQVDFANGILIGLGLIKKGAEENVKVWDKWRTDVDAIVEKSGAYFEKASNETVTYNQYVEDLRKSWKTVGEELDNINVKRSEATDREALVLRNKELLKEKQLHIDIAKALGISLETDKSRGSGSSERIKGLKNQLKVLEDIRALYLQLEGITKDTSLSEVGGEEFLGEIERVFGDIGLSNKIKDELFQAYTDGDFRSYLEKLVKEAETLGTDSGKAFAEALKLKIAEIEKADLIDETKLAAEIEKLRNELLGTFAPFGEGFVFDITLITTKAEANIQDIVDKYDKAMQGANENQIAALNELRDREIEGIRKVRDERIESLVTGSVKKELGNLEQFYTNINDATLRQIKKVDSEIDKIAKKKIKPIELISPEILKQLNRSKEEVEYILNLIENGTESDATLMEAFDLTEYQLQILDDTISKTKTWNLKLSDVVESWKKLSRAQQVALIAQDIGLAAESVQTLSTELAGLANALDMPELAKFAEDLIFASEQISNLSSIAESLATDNIAGAVSGFVGLIANEIKDISTQIDQVKKASEDWESLTASIAHNYALINIESTLAGERNRDIFDLGDPLKSANDALDAFKLTREELGRLGDELNSGKIQDGLKEVYDVDVSYLPGNVVAGSIIKSAITPELEPVFKSLKDKFGEVYDPDTFEINPDILAQYDLLDDKTKELVDDWQETVELMNQAEDQMLSTLENLTGSIGQSLSDSIVDSFINGTNAAEDWGESVETVIEGILEQMLRATFLKPVFDDLQANLEKALDEGADSEDIAGTIADTFADGRIAKSIDLYKNGLSEFQDQFDDFGLNLWEQTAEDAKGLSRGIQGVTEDTANLISSYLNTIRHEVILGNGYAEKILASMQISQSIASQQLSRLAEISSYTLRTAVALESAQSGFKPLHVA